MAGGGTCAAVALNIWPMKPVGVQLAIAMRPPGTADAQQLAGGRLGPRREHRAEHRHDHVERRVAVRHLFGVALVEADVQTLGARAAPCRCRRGSWRCRAPSRSPRRARPGTTRLPEPQATSSTRSPGLSPSRPTNDCRVRRVDLRHAVEVARHPRRLHLRFQALQLCNGLTHNSLAPLFSF